jgi:hypothetical protein
MKTGVLSTGDDGGLLGRTAGDVKNTFLGVMDVPSTEKESPSVAAK